MSVKPFIAIEKKDLEPYYEEANRLVVGASWVPKKDVGASVVKESASPTFSESTYYRSAKAEELSLYKAAVGITPTRGVLLSEGLNHVINIVWQGLCMGRHLQKLYEKASGLTALIDAKEKDILTDAQKTEFTTKVGTSSAIALFVSAYYIVWELQQYRAEETSGIQMDFGGIPEMSFATPQRAYDCMIYYYVAFLQKSGKVRSEAEFIKMTTLYFKGVLEEIKQREPSLGYAEPFTSNQYKLADSEFFVAGFTIEERGFQVTSVEFNRLSFDEIVGNHEAKHKARRITERLLCYDFKEKRNPMHDLGGLTTVRMGDGIPGTGKSMQIAATATLLFDYCKELGFPFLFWPMPDTLVSTYQGGSAERMMNWMKVLKDPTKIIYAPCDDAENNFEDRTRDNVSEGVRGIESVFLRNTEGAYAVNYGNVVIEFFTNLPEQIDRAILSRVMDRFIVDGAITWEDFIDQDHLWWRKYRDIDPKFVGMTDPAYEYLSSQGLSKNLEKVRQDFMQPSDETVKKIFEKVEKQYSKKSHEFFARFFVAVKERFPEFSSRDVRNIQKAVSERIMDFDLDPQWLEKSDLFFKKDYSTKKVMIVDLMKQNMRGLSFSDVRLQETNRYLENFVRISDLERKREVARVAKRIQVEKEALRKVSENI